MISLIQKLGLALCNADGCKQGVEVENLGRHLRQAGHDMGRDDIRKVVEKMEEQLKGLDEEEVRRGREQYGVDDSRTRIGQILPAIPGLPVRRCYKCEKCQYISGSLETFRRKDRCERDPVVCRGQTILGGKKTRYVEVYENGGDNAVVEIMEEVDRGSGEEEEKDVSRMDGFLAELRFDQCLERFGLGMDEAHELAMWRDCEEHSALRRVGSAYLKQAFQESARKAYIQAHKLLDGKLKLAVQSDTLDKYESRVSRLLSFLAVVVRRAEGELCGQVMTRVMRADVEGLMDSLEGDIEESKRILHRVLYDVFFQDFEAGQEVLPLFVACGAVQGDRRGGNPRYGTSSDLSPLLAALKYLGKCVVVSEVYLYPEGGKEIAWENIRKSTADGADTGLMYVEFCLNTAHNISALEVGPMRFIVCPRHGRCGLVDGQELSLGELGEKMREVQRAAWKLFEERLLMGLSLAESFFSGCQKLEDNLLERSPGYWFGKHKGNEQFCGGWRAALARKATGVLFDRKGNANEKEALEYLKSCEELQGLITVLMQVCSGGPARGTEATVVQICNTPHSTRNIFVSQGDLFFVTSYTKIRSLRGGAGKVVVRFPDVDSCRILLCYLIIVRPLENTVVEVLGKSGVVNGSGEKHRNFLFASRGGAVNADRVRYMFQSGMRRVGIEFGTNQYRHYYSGAVKNFLGGKKEVWDLGGSSGMHEQAGHSSTTAHRVYGVSALDMRNISGEEMEGFRASSRAWVRALGLKSEEEEAVLEEEAAERNKVNSGLEELRREMNCRFGKVEEMLSEVLGVLKELKECRKRRADEGNEGPRKSARLMCRDGLARLLKKPGARFRSKEQEEAVEMAISEGTDGIVVLGTGVGKSLCFMLPALVLEKMVVVVVPYTALKEDILRRCGEHGIQAARWEDRNVIDTKVVLASVEHVGSAAYKRFVREKNAMGKLHAIFLDEAHAVVSSVEYRGVMERMEGAIRPSGVNVPVIALSATIPPQIEKEVGRRCGLRDWKTVRGRTARRNIRYSVEKARGGEVRICLTFVVKRLVEAAGGGHHVIVYVQRREQCDVIANVISVMFPLSACFTYHGGMKEGERKKSQVEWEKVGRDETHVMVATNAFGCGIDVGTVRGVVHVGRPSCLMDYIQESGRAGRDGKRAEAVLLDCGGGRNDGGGKFGRMEDFATGTGGCRRRALDKFNDGAEGRGCGESGMIHCDLCEKGAGGEGTPEAVENMEAGSRDGTGNEFSFGNRTMGAEEECGSVEARETVGSLGEGSVEAPSRSTRCSNSVSARELQDAADELKDVCCVCSVKHRREVKHVGKNVGCFKGRCLKCGIRGHDARGCPYLQSANDGTCFQCSIGFYQNEVIHGNGTYGTRHCGMKKLLGLALVCWENVELRRTMRQDLPEVAELGDTGEYSRWLRGRHKKDSDGRPVLGIAILVPWLKQVVLKR